VFSTYGYLETILAESIYSVDNTGGSVNTIVMIYVFVGLKDADNVAVARIPGDVHVTNTLGKEN